ncbi:hypothetical protein GQR58_011536 [Nymphon striatum]|nr:hypothetical protein GQR58_011536 [Nymphon striatum]
MWRSPRVKVVDEVSKVCASENATFVTLKGKKKILELKLKVLAEFDKEILELMVDSEPAEFEKEVSQADVYWVKNIFGKHSAQIQAHISHLLRIQPVPSENSWFLRKLLDSLEINVRRLEALDISGKTYPAILVPILLSRLPDSIKLQWAKLDNSEDSDVKKFLQMEVESQKFVSRNTKDFGDKSISGKQFVKEKLSTSQSLSNNSIQTCVFCGLSHAAYQCETFLNSNRESMVKSHKLCFNYLKPGHCVKDCYSKFSCKTCAKRHHTTLHRQKFATESSTSSEPVNIESPMNADPFLHSHTYTAPTSTIVLQTALVKIVGQTARHAQNNNKKDWEPEERRRVARRLNDVWRSKIPLCLKRKDHSESSSVFLFMVFEGLEEEEIIVNAILAPILLSRLPDSIKLQWAKLDNSEDLDVKDLLKFLQKEVESQEFVSRNTKDFGDKSISGKLVWSGFVIM